MAGSAWERLVSREPRLAERESETRQGTFTTAVRGFGERHRDVLRSIAREQALAPSETRTPLEGAVGTARPDDRSLIKSRAVFEFAMAYLDGLDEAAYR